MMLSRFGSILGILWGGTGIFVAWGLFEGLKRYKYRNVGLVTRHGAEFKHHSREWLENVLSLTAVTGDVLMIVLGFILADRLIYQTEFIPNYLENVPMPSLSSRYELILFGVAVVLWGLTGRELYKYKSLLSPGTILRRFLSAFGFGIAAFIGLSFVLHKDPASPKIYFIAAVVLIFGGIYFWRLILSMIIQHPALALRLRRRLIVIGGGSQTMRIKKGLGENSDMEFVGWVQAIKPNQVPELEPYRLGSLHELGSILQKNAINIAVLTESESLQREGVMAVAKSCENEHVQFKMVPHFFEILITGLRADTIGGIQLLGVDVLPLSGYRNRIIKRTIDIIGALVGLALSFPLMVFFGALVYRESPGPILYKQVRQGRNGRLFHITKIRSMRINAEADQKAQWAQADDKRRLKIGAFLRKWNIDEVPQFWNVLIGEMSLVGPRPERPELIARFKSKIPHYQARHMCRPGMTGWAQVNGWRGNTDLQERIHHDIWYLEHWSLFLDFRIMAMTFFRRDNAY